jgi:hypothetical protein
MFINTRLALLARNRQMIKLEPDETPRAFMKNCLKSARNSAAAGPA